MKAVLTKCIVSFALICSVAVAPAGATLIDRGLFDTDGISGGDTVRLIYDNDLNITWLGDGNFAQTSGYNANGQMNWTTANTWAASLTVGGFTNWRLPTTTQPDASCSTPNYGGFGGQGGGGGCSGSEMGHLFKVEGISAAGPGLFSNVQFDFYWSGTEFAPNPSRAWNFLFRYSGVQDTYTKNTPLFAWAVRSGDVSTTTAAPEPSTMLLLGSGLVGLIGYRMKKAQA